jgi:hypothetical protein
MDRQQARDLPQPTRVVEDLGEGLSLVQSRQDVLRVARRQERRTQGEPQVDGLLTRITLLWQMLEGTECLLDAYDGLVVQWASIAHGG